MGKYFRGHLKKKSKPQEWWRRYDCLPGLCCFLEVNLILGIAVKKNSKAWLTYNSQAHTNKHGPGLTKGLQRSENKWWVVCKWIQPLLSLGQTLLPRWKQEAFCPCPTPEEESRRLPALGGKTHTCLSLAGAREWPGRSWLGEHSGASSVHFLCCWNTDPRHL